MITIDLPAEGSSIEVYAGSTDEEGLHQVVALRGRLEVNLGISEARDLSVALRAMADQATGVRDLALEIEAARAELST